MPKKTNKTLIKAVGKGLLQGQISVTFAGWCFVIMVMGPALFFCGLAELIAKQAFWSAVFIMLGSLILTIIVYYFAYHLKKNYKFPHADWGKFLIIFYYSAPIIGLLLGLEVYLLITNRI